MVNPFISKYFRFNRIFVILLQFLFAIWTDIPNESFSEKLLIRPLEDDSVLTHFEFNITSKIKKKIKV